MGFDDLANRMAATHGKQVSNAAPSMAEFAQTGWLNRRRDAIHHIVRGCLLLVLGIAVTAITTWLSLRDRGTAVPSTGLSILWYGAIIAGGVELGWGRRLLRSLPARP